jgi:hypothetical protein
VVEIGRIFVQNLVLLLSKTAYSGDKYPCKITIWRVSVLLDLLLAFDNIYQEMTTKAANISVCNKFWNHPVNDSVIIIVIFEVVNDTYINLWESNPYAILVQRFFSKDMFPTFNRVMSQFIVTTIKTKVIFFILWITVIASLFGSY